EIRPLPPRIRSAFRISSFTAVTRRLGEEGLLPEMPSAAPSSKVAPILSQPVCLEAFPRGAGAGDFFHGVLEEMDFTGGRGQVETWVDKRFLEFGFRGKELRDMAVDGLDQVIRTPLEDGTQGFTLGDIPMEDRISELPFHFLSENFNVARLAQVFKGHSATRDYGALLEQSTTRGRFTGFINGFIDLVVRFQGRWYILDYKSNYLGSTYGDYLAPALDRAMVSHHYILQYHLYLVALDRYLALRLPDYEYERDMGGVFYLFLRGMHPTAREAGVYFNRPSREMMVQLSRSL
ncbi:MAG: PD-(D/E)XK nuclease family protein, partial [Desulfovibrionales bacterium]|nr:PD-(D/E)XK nuclease family protein [Desulfovibrionales bacterium]